MIDASVRFDRSKFALDNNQLRKFNWATGGPNANKYIAGDGVTRVRKTFDLWSMRVGGSYAIDNDTNLYGSLAQSDQVPSNGEVETNTALDASTTRTFEIGAKGRRADFSYDVAAYYTIVDGEIVATSDNNETVYRNAGEVEKKGLEFAGNYALTDQFTLGANYAYSHFTFNKFNEPVRTGANLVNTSRAGNVMPYVPRHQMSLSVNYDSGWGLKGGIRTEHWSRYYMDNANTDWYSGYKFITNANLSYDVTEDAALSMNIENLLDKKYAVEAKKSTDGTRSFSAGQPRTFVVSYRQNF